MQERIGQPQDQPTPAPGDVYTRAARSLHGAHCPPCSDVTTRLTAFDASLAASTARVDRYTLGLRPARTTAVTA